VGGRRHQRARRHPATACGRLLESDACQLLHLPLDRQAEGQHVGRQRQVGLVERERGRRRLPERGERVDAVARQRPHQHGRPTAGRQVAEQRGQRDGVVVELVDVDRQAAVALGRGPEAGAQRRRGAREVAAARRRQQHRAGGAPAVGLEQARRARRRLSVRRGRKRRQREPQQPGGDGGQCGERIHRSGDPNPTTANVRHPDANRPRAGTLYVVATPIGHLDDLSHRAEAVLRGVDCVAAEDTRVTQKLLARLGARPAMLAAHAHNEAEAAARVVERLGRGESVALVTDAGTPALSDPGSRVVAAVHEAGCPVVPVPGPSAAAAMLSAAGLGGGGRFRFEGFLPAAPSGLAARAAELAAADAPVVLFEAPHRIVATLAALRQACGDARLVALGRELTKLHEEIFRGTLEAAAGWLHAREGRVRGEFVLVLDAAPPTPAGDADEAELDRVLGLLLPELPVSQAARLAARLLDLPKNRAYARALALDAEDGAAAVRPDDGAPDEDGAPEHRAPEDAPPDAGGKP
jgi:16S rRNA (cytidine1402-2'-O)-methyltransferase